MLSVGSVAKYDTLMPLKRGVIVFYFSYKTLTALSVDSLILLW
jgi:hypothetical protein